MGLRNLEGLGSRGTSSFYSQSWVVHYLNVGRDDAKPREELTRYLKALRSGVGNEEAVRTAFGTDTGSLDRPLQNYIKRGHYVFVTAPLDLFDPGAEPQLRALSSAEAAVALGSLAADRGDYEQAEAYYVAALATAPGNPRGLAGRGRARAGQGNWQEAESWYAKALAAGPDDFSVQLDYDSYLHALARGAPDAAGAGEFAQQARRHYTRSWKLEDSIPETYAGYGSTFLLEGQDPAAGLETLEHAHRMLPSSIEIKLLLARAYSQLGRRDEARELALIASMWNHSQEADEKLRALLDAAE